MIPPKRFAAIDHLDNVELVPEQMREAADPEGAPANDTAIGELAMPGPYAGSLKVLCQSPALDVRWNPVPALLSWWSP